MADIRVIAGGRTGCSPSTTMRIYRAIALPKFEYGAAIWAPELPKNQWDTIEQTQLRFARRIIGCGRDAANAFVTGELGLRSVRGHCDEIALRWFGELYHTPKNRLVSRIFRSRWDDAQHFIHRYKTCTNPDPTYDDAAIDAFSAAHPQCPKRAIPIGKYAWAKHMRALFDRYGLTPYWTGSKPIPLVTTWKTVVREAITKIEHAEWRSAVSKLSTLFDALLVKCER